MLKEVTCIVDDEARSSLKGFLLGVRLCDRRAENTGITPLVFYHNLAMTHINTYACGSWAVFIDANRDRVFSIDNIHDYMTLVGWYAVFSV